MRTTFFLFPDSREGRRGIGEVNASILRRNGVVPRSKSHPRFAPAVFAYPDSAWQSWGTGMTPDEMLSILKGVNWDYPVKVIYRAEPDHVWSFVTLGLSPLDRGEDE